MVINELRTRIIRQQSNTSRREQISEYQQHDILGCLVHDEQVILENLLLGPSNLLRL